LGSAVAAALDRLLTATAGVTVDATSERMLQDRALAPETLAGRRELSRAGIGVTSETQWLLDKVTREETPM
jgi:hypothetical protein